MLYEAKVLDSRPTEDNSSWQYKIHYKGWKNTVWVLVFLNSIALANNLTVSPDKTSYKIGELVAFIWKERRSLLLLDLNT